MQETLRIRCSSILCPRNQKIDEVPVTRNADKAILYSYPHRQCPICGSELIVADYKDGLQVSAWNRSEVGCIGIESDNLENALTDKHLRAEATEILIADRSEYAASIRGEIRSREENYCRARGINKDHARKRARIVTRRLEHWATHPSDIDIDDAIFRGMSGIEVDKFIRSYQDMSEEERWENALRAYRAWRSLDHETSISFDDLPEEVKSTGTIEEALERNLR